MNTLRHSLRQLALSPGFILLAVLSLPVGIGINTTIFSAMDAALLRPLPISHPEDVVIFGRPALSLANYAQVSAGMNPARPASSQSRLGGTETGVRSESPISFASRNH
jgi:hypothetical protein